MPESFGQTLRQARVDAGIQLVAFARRSGYSESYLRRVENGIRPVTEPLAEVYDELLEAEGELLAAFHRSQGADPVPWDTDGTLTVLDRQVDWGDVERRSFVVATAFPLMARRWRAALRETAPLASESRTKIPLEPLLNDIRTRLMNLWRLDDELGSRSVSALAYNELNLIKSLIKQASYGDTVGEELNRLAAEAARQVAWGLFDQGKPDRAAGFFETALRCSANASDPVTGAYAMSFAAVQAYSDPKTVPEAVEILESATVEIRGKSTPRMAAMLAARHARALSKTGDRRGCARLLDAARDQLNAGAHDDDPPALYWVTHREVEMIAGSSALDLGDPAEALRRFTAAANTSAPSDDEYPRSDAIYLARAAEAHLGMRDLDGAVEAADQAMRCLGGVESARSSSTLTALRTKLEGFSGATVVTDFLERTS